ncbi:reverse transcriptase domain-containing protein [Tanacetum coccineum]
MRTRSQARRRRQPQVRQTSVESSNLEKPDNPPIVTMADNRTMAQLLEAPTEGYEDAIVIPEITANNFEIKHGLLNLVQNKQFFGHDKEDPHAHIRYFNKITSTMKIPNVPIRVRQSRNQAVGAKMEYKSSTQAVSSEVAELKTMVRALILDRKNQTPVPPPFLLPVWNSFLCNTITNPKEDLKGITTRSGVTIQGPKAVNQDVEVTKDTMPPTNNGSTEDVQPPVVQIQTRNPNPEPNVAPVVTPASIPFPSRRNDEKRKEKANDQIEKFYEIFRDLSFEISFTDALMLMPKFASTLKTLIGNKEKLSELARTPLNENCSAVILSQSNKETGDPGRFLISSEIVTGITNMQRIADLELADRSITEPIGIAKDVRLMVGKFQFPADFVVVDFEPDPRVPLILGRCFLKTSHALIDVYGGEITLRVGKEAITFNLDQTSKYTADYDHMTANKIDVIEMACDEYSQEVLGFSNVIASGNPTPYFEPIVSTASPTLTPFGDSDFLLFEEADSFLALEDDPTSSEVDPTYQDPEGDILILEAILNSEPPPPLPNHEQYMPGGRKELKLCEAKTVEPSINEPPEVELKELPPHLEYAFLEGDDKLPVIIAKDLKDEEKAALLKVLKSHKRAIAWKLSDIKGVSPEFCTHKILMEEDYEPSVQSQRRVNPKIHDVIKKEVEKLLDAGLIYPI